MKKLWLILTSICVLFLAGCTEDKLQIEYLEKTLGITKSESQLFQKKFNNIKNNVSQLSYGITYTLGKNTSNPETLLIVKELNDRIQGISGMPTVEQVKEITNIVDLLLSKIVEERKQGLVLLNKKDKELEKSRKEIEDFELKYKTDVQKYKDEVSDLLAKADDANKKLREMDKWFGVGAIWYGIKKLVSSLLWGFVGIGVLFTVIRICSGLNVAPIFNILMKGIESFFASIFSVFKWIVPGAFKLIGYVTQQDFFKVKESRNKIVDQIEYLKNIQKEHPDKIFTLKELLDRLAESMTDEDKKEVETALKELKWKA